MYRKILVMALFALLAWSVLGEPTGTSIALVGNSTKQLDPAQNRTDLKGSITTIVMSAVQQNYKWKAYVGNISATFTLDDADDYTIYQWTLDSITGEVYATRSDTAPTWSGIGCGDAADKAAEDTALSHDSTRGDSINRTFSTATHKAFNVGPVEIDASTCYATTTYMNDTAVVLAEDAAWQEVLLHDGTNMIYTSFVEENTYGYRNGTTNDFQMILPDDAVSTNATIPYFFYVELE